MAPLSKAFLLPIDDSEESLRPIRFLTQLYPERSHINLILHYLMPGLPPIYKEKNPTETQIAKKKAFLREREAAAERALQKARKVLVEAGFSEDVIHEFVQEKELSVAHHACRLGDVRRVDAVVIQKQTSSRLESFLKGDHVSALLHHCLISPIWFVDEDVRTDKALVCLADNQASLRALDHALFMLEEASTEILVVHFSKDAPSERSVSAASLETDPEGWLPREASGMRSFLFSALELVRTSGVAPDRVRFVIRPFKRKLPVEILDYSRSVGAGILVLGHGGSGGTWGFLKKSVTKQILLDFRAQAVWVNQ